MAWIYHLLPSCKERMGGLAALLALACMFMAGPGQPRPEHARGEEPIARPDSQAPAPVINVRNRRGMAPFAVHVHALRSDLGVGDPLTARYEWNFGDPAGPFNGLVGWNAAHVYDRPGEYVITLTIRNQSGREAETSVQVTVTPDARRRLYVAGDGDDANPGRSPDAPLETFAGAMRRMHHDTVVLFKRGDVFDVHTPAEIGWRNWGLGAYGEADRPPILRWAGSPGRSVMIGMSGEQCRDVVIEDLAFDSRHHDVAERDIVDALRPAGSNVTVRNCTFGDVTTALNCERDPVGLLTMNNRAEGLRAYFVWGEGTDHSHLGNTVRGSRIEHNLRFAGAERVLIAHNKLTNEPKRTIWAMTGSHMYIARNELHDGRLTVGPNHAVGDPADRMKWAVVEANAIEKPSPATAAVEVEHGAERVAIRNNVITVAGSAAIDIKGRSDSMNRNAVDVRIVNNTVVNDATVGSFLRCGSDPEGVAVANNLFIAPRLVTGEHKTAIMFVLDDDLSGFTTISNNAWPRPAQFKWVGDGHHYLWNSWSNAEGYRNIEEWGAFRETTGDLYENLSLDDAFRPDPDNHAVGHAQYFPGVFDDFLGRERPRDGGWTAGALEVR